MKILQIACGMSYTKVYKNLFNVLENQKMNFEVYIPQRSKELVEQIKNSNYTFSYYTNRVIYPHDKLLYFSKLNRMTNDIIRNFDLKSMDMIHAHSLFSDGGVAYNLKKKFNIPYIVAIRDTDVNQYFKKAIHLKKHGIKILKNAEKIVFLSNSYKNKVLELYIEEQIKNSIEKKCVVIPNGIDDFWHDNKNVNTRQIDKSNIKLIYVGQIIKRKNILKVLEALEILKNQYKLNVEISVIGEVKDTKYFNLMNKTAKFNYIERIPKEELIKYYQDADIFVMPSYTETFGLVYVEAMSQGLPIIYTQNEGFDGQFQDGEVGFRVNPHSALDIANKINKLIENYNLITVRLSEKIDKFKWSDIARQYKELYMEVNEH